MTIFGVLFPDGFDYDAGFIANLDKSKDSDGKIFKFQTLILWLDSELIP